MKNFQQLFIAVNIYFWKIHLFSGSWICARISNCLPILMKKIGKLNKMSGQIAKLRKNEKIWLNVSVCIDFLRNILRPQASAGLRPPFPTIYMCTPLISQPPLYLDPPG